MTVGVSQHRVAPLCSTLPGHPRRWGDGAKCHPSHILFSASEWPVHPSTGPSLTCPWACAVVLHSRGFQASFGTFV